MAKITTARKRVWKKFSKYIRKSASNFQGYANCFTCGIQKPWEELQAGHFIHGVTKMTYFEETNVHPQCARCNMHLSGDHINYTLKMIDKYGRDEVERLRILSESSENWTIKKLQEIESKYE